MHTYGMYASTHTAGCQVQKKNNAEHASGRSNLFQNTGKAATMFAEMAKKHWSQLY